MLLLGIAVADRIYEARQLSPDLRITLALAAGGAPCDPADVARLQTAQARAHTRRDRTDLTRLRGMVASCAAVATLQGQERQREADDAAGTADRAHRLQLMIVMEQAYLMSSRPLPPGLQGELDSAFDQDRRHRDRLRSEKTHADAEIARESARAAQLCAQLRQDLSRDAR